MQLKTQAEIIERLTGPRDPFGLWRRALARFLDEPERAKVVDDDDNIPLTEGSVREDLAEAISTGWEAVVRHDGPSAYAIIPPLQAILWLLGEDVGVPWSQTAQYGAPILFFLSDRYELAHPIEGLPSSIAISKAATVEERQKLGNERERILRTHPIGRMATGLPCVDGCRKGCGP